MDHKVDEAVGEHHVDQEVDELEFRASNSSFASGEEPKDESNLNYDLIRDR